MGDVPSGKCSNIRQADDVRLPFGQVVADGRLIHISQVSSGLACGCLCPGCGATLVAKKGERTTHHFAHHGDGACATGLESALHRFAKQVIADRKEIALPAVVGEFGGRSKAVREASTISFDTVEVERPFGSIIPDLIAHVGAKRLLIEIAVFHEAEATKIEFVGHNKLPTVEIDLSKASFDASDLAAVEDIVLNQAPRRWLYNPLAEQAIAEIKADIAEEERKREQSRLRQEAERLKREEEERRKREWREKKSKAAAETVTRLLDRKEALDKAAAIRMKEMQDWPMLYRGVRETNLLPLIGLRIPGDICFAYPAHYWQAAILDRYVISRRPNFKTEFALKFCSDQNLLLQEFEVFMDTLFDALVTEKHPDFQRPYYVIQAYLDRLRKYGVLDCSRGWWKFRTLPKPAP